MTNKYKSIPRTGWVLEGRIISMELLVLGATDSQANPWIISVSSRREGWSETTRHSFCRLQVLRYIFMPPFWEGRGWASITWTSKGKRFIFYITFKQKKMDVIHLFFLMFWRGHEPRKSCTVFVEKRWWRMTCSTFSVWAKLIKLTHQFVSRVCYECPFGWVFNIKF